MELQAAPLPAPIAMIGTVARTSVRAVARAACARARVGTAAPIAQALSAVLQAPSRFMATEADTDASRAMNKVLTDALEAEYVMVRDVSGEAKTCRAEAAHILFVAPLTATSSLLIGGRRRLRVDVPGSGSVQ